MAADLNVTERVIRLDGERGERGPAVWLPWWPLVVCSARQLLPKAHHRSHFCTQPKNNQAQSVVVRPRTLPHHDGVIVMYTREEKGKNERNVILILLVMLDEELERKWFGLWSGFYRYN